MSADNASGPAPTGNAEIDIQNDTTAVVTAAKASALAEVAGAASLIDKLATMIATDAPVLLDEEEQNAVPQVVSKFPAPLRGEIAKAIENTLAGNAYDGMFKIEIARALDYLKAEVANVEAHADRAIDTL